MDKKKAAVELIKKCEGRKLVAYKCSAGKWTIGFGNTKRPSGVPIKPGDTCTAEEAETWLKSHLETDVYPFVDKLCKGYDVPDSVWSALCSFAYNAGVGHFTKLSFTKPVLTGDWGTWEGTETLIKGRIDYKTTKATGLCATFVKYDKETVKGKLEFNQGLHNRRVAEIKFMLKGLG